MIVLYSSPEGCVLGDEWMVCYCFILFLLIFRERLDCSTEHPFCFLAFLAEQTRNGIKSEVCM